MKAPARQLPQPIHSPLPSYTAWPRRESANHISANHPIPIRNQAYPSSIGTALRDPLALGFVLSLGRNETNCVLILCCPLLAEPPGSHFNNTGTLPMRAIDGYQLWR
jgi:hypothetical protein